LSLTVAANNTRRRHSPFVGAVTTVALPPTLSTAATAGSPALEAVRRVVESVVIAVATSTGVYLVDSVYTGAY
jgi:hypothetical protein